MIDDRSSEGASEAAIRLVERARPGSGFLRELCLRSFKYNGRHHWDAYSAAITAGEVLGRNFAADADIEKQLATILEMIQATREPS